MPVEAKKFAKVDKDWIKIMAKSLETSNVVACCSNELLKNTLPIIFGELERCQKSLEGYLEQKRGKFPRFYFVSNPVLLQILSQGSDPQAVQKYYENIFDGIFLSFLPVFFFLSFLPVYFVLVFVAVNKVVHDKRDKKSILQLKSIGGVDEEIVTLAKPVYADGNIEDWLSLLEKEMQRTLKGMAAEAAVDCSTMDLREFVDKNCGQFALLGLQFNWTAQCQEALDKCRTSKGIVQDTAKRQDKVLAELSSWCLQDLGTKLNRMKVETLVTIQVHQRDVFADLTKLFKERKIQESSDFEWLKQVHVHGLKGDLVQRVPSRVQRVTKGERVKGSQRVTKGEKVQRFKGSRVRSRAQG
jgi:dynein heavy chain